MCVCVCDVFVCLVSLSPLQGYNADVHAETPFGWSVLVYAALSDQVRGKQHLQGGSINGSTPK